MKHNTHKSDPFTGKAKVALPVLRDVQPAPRPTGLTDDELGGIVGSEKRVVALRQGRDHVTGRRIA